MNFTDLIIRRFPFGKLTAGILTPGEVLVSSYIDFWTSQPQNLKYLTPMTPPYGLFPLITDKIFGEKKINIFKCAEKLKNEGFRPAAGGKFWGPKPIMDYTIDIQVNCPPLKSCLQFF